MNVLEEYKNVVNNDVEVYLLNFKQHLLEHMRHNDIKACNETLVEINNLQNGIKRGHIVGSNYFLDVLLQMRQLTRNVAKCVKNKNNTLLNESAILHLNNSSTQSIIDVYLLKRIIKYKLMSTDAINELQCKLRNAINANGNNVDLVECDQLFGTYSNNGYKQLYEVIIKSNYIYDSEQNNNTMSKTKQQNTGDTISINEIKSMIDTIINETLANEIDYNRWKPLKGGVSHNVLDYGEYEPIDSSDDFAGDNLDDLTDTVNTLIANVKNETGDWDKSYDRLVDIYKKLTDAIDNPRLSSSQRKRLEHDYDGILGNIHRIIGGGGGGAEKFYVAEATSKPINDRQRMLIIKWCETMGCRKAAIRMIDSILNTSIGLSSADLADTATLANGVDGIEDALEAQDYQGAYEMAKDTASEMVAEEGGDDLMEGSDRFSVYYQQKNPSSVSKTGGWRIAATFADKVAAEKFAKDSKNKQEYGEMSVDKYDSDYDSDYDLDESYYENKCNCGEKCNCKQLSECGSWNEAIKHPQFKQAIMKEVAPPGMEKWIKSNKERFKKQYGDKKGIGALYATAWRMFYKNK